MCGLLWNSWRCWSPVPSCTHIPQSRWFWKDMNQSRENTMSHKPPLFLSLSDQRIPLHNSIGIYRVPAMRYWLQLECIFILSQITLWDIISLSLRSLLFQSHLKPIGWNEAVRFLILSRHLGFPEWSRQCKCDFITSDKCSISSSLKFEVE